MVVYKIAMFYHRDTISQRAQMKENRQSFLRETPLMTGMGLCVYEKSTCN